MMAARPNYIITLQIQAFHVGECQPKSVAHSQISDKAFPPLQLDFDQSSSIVQMEHYLHRMQSNCDHSKGEKTTSPGEKLAFVSLPTER